MRYQTTSASSRSSAALPFAPTMRFTGAPSLNKIIVGIDTTWKSRAVAGFESTSILATVSWPAFSLAISSRTGATILHGPHQVAQKSTSTGVLLDNTSLEKVSSVTATVAVVSGMVELLSDGCCSGLIGWGRGGFGQPAFGVDGRRTAGARSGDGLSVRVVAEVACGEHALDGGRGGAMFHRDVAVGVQFDLAADQIRARVVT